MMAHVVGTARLFRRIDVAELPDEATFVVAPGEDPAGAGAARLLQRALAPDAQDADPGQDTYWLADERGAVVYGGPTGSLLARDTVTLHFTAEASATLALASPCQFRLRVSPITIEHLRAGLRRILADDAITPATLVLRARVDIAFVCDRAVLCGKSSTGTRARGIARARFSR